MTTSRYTLQRYIARHIIPGERIGICCVSPARHTESYNGHVTVHNTGEGSCKLRGLSYCEGIWVCPVCSAIIRTQRQKMTECILKKSVTQGYTLYFLTLTLAHHKRQKLADVLAMQAKAWRAVVISKAWRALSVQRGSKWYMRALEVTHGANGWHPHYHVVLAASSANGDEVMHKVIALWRAAVAALGGSSVEYAQNVQRVDNTNVTDIAEYVSSWGGGEWSMSREMVSDTKTSRRGGRSPFQLAADAMAGDDEARALYREYATAIKGKKAQTWSRLWLAAVEVTEEEINDETIKQHELTDDTVVIAMPSYCWPELGSDREHFIDAVESRDLSLVYDIVDRRGIILAYIQLSYFLGAGARSIAYDGGGSHDAALLVGAAYRSTTGIN